MEIALRSGASIALALALRMQAACGAATGLVALVDHVAMRYLGPLSEVKAPQLDGYEMVGGEQEIAQPALSKRNVEVIRTALAGTVLVALAAAISLYSGVAFLTVLGQVAITYNATRIITPFEGIR